MTVGFILLGNDRIKPALCEQAARRLLKRQIYRIGNMKKAGIVCGQTKPTQQTVYISYRHSDYATSLPSAFVISPRSAVRNSFISSSLSISSRKMRATVEKQ